MGCKLEKTRKNCDNITKKWYTVSQGKTVVRADRRKGIGWDLQ